MSPSSLARRKRFAPRNVLQWVLDHGIRLIAIVLGMIFLNRIAAFFSQTTTLGIRVEDALRCELGRDIASVDDSEGVGARVKTADRPGGVTKKADVDDVDGATLAERRARRQELEK